MTIQANIEAVERMLTKKQAVPSKMVHDLATDTKALLALSRSQRSQIERLQFELAQAREQKDAAK